MTPDAEPPTRGGYELPPAPPDDPAFAGPAEDPDRYELVGAGITGGEGTTWRARYRGRLRAPLPLAVKLLRPPPGAAPGWPSAAERRRWQDQAALLRHLRLDHVVRLHEIFSGPPPHPPGTPGDGPVMAYLVMEWIDGPTLSRLCRGIPAGRTTVAARLRYVTQAATALAVLSSDTLTAGNASLHRDVKPGNCIIARDRGLVLIDVSTLRPIDDGFDSVGLHTPQYTAPEVRAAPHRPRTPAAEAYSLGALTAYCLTGQDPGPAPDLRAELVAAALAAEVAGPEALAAHILTALDPDPGRRPTDLVRWGERLERLGRRRQRIPALRLLIALTAMLALLGGSHSRGHGKPPARPAPGTPPGYAGAIRSPADGGHARQCEYFTGTAVVPPGMTLILAMRNLDNGDPGRYPEVVHHFDDPARLRDWRGAQYFGREDATVGQRYQVQLLAVRTAAAVAWRADDAEGAGTRLAAGGVPLDTVTLTRIPGPGPSPGCEGD